MNLLYRGILYLLIFVPGVALSQITVTIYEDLNGNGSQDVGEPGIGGLAPQLFFDQDMDGTTAEFNTMIVPTQPMAGTYVFTVPSNGFYQVNFQNPAGSNILLSPASGQSPLINYPAVNTTIAGYVQSAMISGICWIDNNGDGLRNDPTVLPGTTVTLTTNLGAPVTDLNGNPVSPFITGPAGTYLFTNLPPGIYKLTFNPPAAAPSYYTTTYNAAGGPDELTDAPNDSDANPANANMTFDLTITSAENLQNIDGGFYQPGSLGNFVWKDLNANGIYEAGEMGIGGFTLNIQYSNGNPVTDVNNNPVGPQVTNAVGNYNFQNLRPGLYNVSITLLPMYFLSNPDQGGNDNQDSDFNTATFNLVSPVQINSNTTITNIYAGVFKNIQLSGTVWIEQDDNGMQSGSETGIAGVQVNILNSITNVAVASSVTDATGTYNLSVRPGSYIVSVISTNFNSGQALDGLISCTPTWDAENNLDMDDNGMGPVNGPVNSSVITLNCGQEPNGSGDANNTVDFCFRFNCAASSSLAARTCNTVTNIICDLNILDAGCATMFSPPVVAPFPNPLCDGGGGAHNMSWFAFVAGQGNYSIEVIPISCVPGSDPTQIGMQVGLYSDCTFNNSIFCRNDCSTDPVSIPSSALEPGNTYYFWLDGCNGSVCVYEINVTSGFQPYSIPQPTGVECVNSNNCSPICPNNVVSVRALSGYDNLVAEYEWRVTSPSGVITTVNSTSNILNYTVTELGFYKFEIIRIRNVCFTTSQVRSIMIEVKHPANENFGTDNICPSALSSYTGPLTDDNGNPNPNGDNFSGWLTPSFNFQLGVNTVPVSIQGCNFTQTINLVEVPLSPPNSLTYYACQSEFPVTIGGQVFNAPTPFQAIFTQDVNGCDSTIFLTLLQVDADGVFQLNGCQGNMAILEFVKNITFVPGMTESVKWKFNSVDFDDGNPDGNPYTILVNQNGTYSIEITLNINGKICGPFNFSYTFNFTPLLPTLPAINGVWDTELCEPTGTVSYSVSGSSNTESYQWTFPSDVALATGQGTNTLNLMWGNSSGGQICVKASNQCGTSSTVCRNIVVRKKPEADFTLVSPICVDDLATLSSSSPSNSNYNYIWNLDGGMSVMTPNSNGRDTIQVKWDQDGKKIVSLYIDFFNCDSDIHIDSILLLPKLSVPVVSCTSGSNSIEFFWTPPVEQVQPPTIVVTSGQSGVLSGNMYTVSSLVPGVTVDVSVTFNVDHPCGNVTSTGSCVTQNCVPETITFDPIPDICLTASSSVINLKNYVNSTTTSGTYAFTGPGVTDMANGIFDPKVAGTSALPHQIRLIYTDATGCVSAAAFVDILVKPTPTSDFAFDPIICQDSTSRIQYTGSISSGGVYNWNFGSDVKTPGTGRGPFGVDWNTPGSKTITLNTTLNGCPSTPTTHMVTVEPRINPVTITCPIEGTTMITFDWNDVTNITDYQLTLNGQALPNTNQSSLVLTNLTVNTDYTLIVNAPSNNSCPGVADTLRCSTSDCPPVFIKFSQKDTTLCLTPNMPNITINATVTGGLQSPGQTITWSGPGVTQGANDKIGIFNPNVAGQGVHTIKASLKDGTCMKDTTMKITIINKPQSTFTGDDLICITDPYVLKYTGSLNLPLDWKLPNGVTINRVGQTNDYRVTFPSDGTYNLGLVTGNPGCVSDQTNLTVKVDPELDTVVVNCQVTTTSVAFSWNDINCASSYQVKINNVASGTQSNLSYNVTGLMVGENVEIEILPVSTCACPAMASTRICTAKDCPPITLKLDAPVSRFCEGAVTNNINLDATVTGSSGTGSGTWSGTGITAQGVFSPAGKIPGVYKFYYSFTEESCDYKDSISIEIYPVPAVTAAAVQPDCYQDNFGSATISVLGGTTPYVFSLNNNNVTPPLTSLSPASYQLVVTDDNGCTATTAFAINAASEPQIAISGAASVNKGGSVELKATVTPQSVALDSLVWKNLAGNIVCAGTNCATVTVTPEQNEKYCVTAYFNGGCTVSDCFDVQVISIIDVVLPNVISQNGNNPSFYVQSYDKIKSVKSMNIFDRWGNNVFTRDNITAGDPAQGWDGKYKSTPVTPGVYVYKIEVEYNDGTTELFSGDVTVIR